MRRRQGEQCRYLLAVARGVNIILRLSSVRIKKEDCVQAQWCECVALSA